MKLEMKYKNKSGIHTKHTDDIPHATKWPFQFVNEENKGEIKKIPWDKQKWRHNRSKFTGCRETNAKRFIPINTYIKKNLK